MTREDHHSRGVLATSSFQKVFKNARNDGKVILEGQEPGPPM